MNFKPTNCPSCGGQLQVLDDRDSVKCMYCGNEIVLREAIQKIPGSDPSNFIGLAKISANEGNFEKAFYYCDKALELDFKNPDTWFVKARCDGLCIELEEDASSRVALHHRYAEMRTDFENTLKYASNNLKKKYINKIVPSINEIIVTTNSRFIPTETQYGVALNTDPEMLIQQEFLHNIYPRQILELEFALSLKPKDETTLKNIVEIYNKIIVKTKKECEGYCYPDMPYSDRKCLEKKAKEELAKSIEEMNKFVSQIEALDPSYEPPFNKDITKKSDCFVITATMGNRNDPNVFFLQYFRDTWLLNRKSGRMTNRLYEVIGPCFADIIRNRSILRFISLQVIVKPAVWVTLKILKKYTL